MKIPKKKKQKEELEIEGVDAAKMMDDDDGRPVPFNALAELTSSDVIDEVKRGMSSIEPLDLEEELNEDAA